jgi:putative hydrolase of the HAD superfamily
MAHVQAILFDLGNVLIDIEEDRIAQSYRNLLGEEAYEQASAYCAERDLFNRYERGELSEEEFLEILAAAAPGKLSRTQLLNAWNSMLIGFPAHRLELLETLKEQKPLYVLSNTNETHLRWIYRNLEQVHGIPDFDDRFFKRAYYSHLIGARKPEARAFVHVLKDAGLDPGTTLFIDDKPENIEAAQGAGLQTHLHNDGRDVNEVLNALGLLS